MGYEILDHTADFGVRIYGKTLDELFQSGFTAVRDAMVEIKEKGEKLSEIIFKEEGETLEDLLVSFLSEVIFHTIVYGRVFIDCQLEVKEHSINAKLLYEDFNPSKHRLKKEIKSVTYHNLQIKQTPEGYEATIICDV
ncbi:MAG: archease [candidate division WOR-3 bacterium]